MTSEKGARPQGAPLFPRPAKSLLVSVHVRCALTAAAAAVLALAGHLLDIPLLSRLLPNRPALSPMTAVAVLVAATALAMLRSEASRAFSFASIQIALGVAIAAAHAADIPERGWLPTAW